MRVEHLMTKKVNCCARTDRLNEVSHAMWQGDCGVVPVVDADRRVVGIVTDRDVCMAAYTTGRSLGDLIAEDAMSRTVHCCRQDDTIGSVSRLMRELQVRRLPVVDQDQRLVGLVGLGDLARAAAEDTEGSREFVATFAAVSRPRKLSERAPRSAAPTRKKEKVTA